MDRSTEVKGFVTPTSDQLDTLRKVSIFEGLSTPELAHIAQLEQERTYPKNTIIFMEGERGRAFYYVKSGLIKIYKLTPDGKEQILAVWGAPELFGAVIMLDQGPYPANAETITTVTVGAFLIDDFRKLLAENPELGGKVMREVAYRLRTAHNRIRDLALKDVKSRLAGMLLDLAARHGDGDPQAPEFELELTHQQLANLVGASRETITRAINDLKDSGVLEQLKGSLHRLNKDEMELLLD